MSVVPVVPVSGRAAEDDELRSFVYRMGFLHAAWSDTVLSISNLPILRLHALFISQSPTLYHHLSNQTAQQGQYRINLESKDPGLTAPAVSTALATLYGHPMDLQTCDFETARAMVAAASLLGLDQVTRQAYDLLLKSLCPELLPTFIEFALQPSYVAGDQSTDKGPYPAYTSGLISYLLDYVFEHFEVQNLNGTWQRFFEVIPFEIYKEIVESPRLKIQSPMERHSFANKVTKARKRSDEQVLLAFGNGTQGVQIVRRNRAKNQQKR